MPNVIENTSVAVNVTLLAFLLTAVLLCALEVSAPLKLRHYGAEKISLLLLFFSPPAQSL